MLAGHPPGGRMSASLQTKAHETSRAASPPDVPALAGSRPTICEIGVTRLFGSADLGCSGMISGWASPEEGHNWNDGPEAEYALAVVAPAGALTLEIVGQPYLPRQLRFQEMTMYGNGFRLCFRRLTARGETCLSIPLLPQWWFVEQGMAHLRLAFHLPNSARPDSLGDGADARELGFAFRSLCLRARLS